KNKAGKAVLTLGTGEHPLSPLAVGDPGAVTVAAATSAGRLLVFPASELPQLPRGKGVKLIGIPRAKAEEEVLAALAILPAGCGLKVHAGRRHLGLKASELEPFRGARALRGAKLPQGFRNVARLEVS
ncbi:MAG TPA: DNA gyrase C-terminal beta-propeller domain-containing protein, partial [Thermoanaerobaculia bacterium]|nr:DNA gyrase C-terminal beta-propeller domain-containing protein [Thermoanaerobaculia bacterium]